MDTENLPLLTRISWLMMMITYGVFQPIAHKGVMALKHQASEAFDQFDKFKPYLILLIWNFLTERLRYMPTSAGTWIPKTNYYAAGQMDEDIVKGLETGKWLYLKTNAIQ